MANKLNMVIRRKVHVAVCALLFLIFTFSLQVLVFGALDDVTPATFEAKLAPHEETSFNMTVSSEAIREAMTALKVGELEMVTLDATLEEQEYLFWEPHSYDSVGPNDDLVFTVFVFTPWDQEAPATINVHAVVVAGGYELGWTNVTLFIEPLEDDVDTDHDFHPHSPVYAEPGEVAVTTAIATVGSVGAGVATGGLSNTLDLGRVSEGIRKRRKVSISRLGQLWTLILSTALIGLAYALLTSAIISLGPVIELPFSLPYIGSSLPVSYISGINFTAFIEAAPVIMACSGIVFLWRYFLEVLTARVLGLKVALAANNIGAASLIGTTILTHPYGFPMTSVVEGHTTNRDRGYLAFMKNFGLLALVLPFSYVQQEMLLGDLSFLVGTSGTLIALMTFFYTSIPYQGEGIAIFRWSKLLDIALIVSGLVLYFGYKTSMLPQSVFMGAGAAATLITFVALIRLQMKRKDYKDDRFFEEVHP